MYRAPLSTRSYDPHGNDCSSCKGPGWLEFRDLAAAWWVLHRRPLPVAGRCNSGILYMYINKHVRTHGILVSVCVYIYTYIIERITSAIIHVYV